MRRSVASIAIAALLLTAAPAATAATKGVSIVDYAFSPASTSLVALGDSVTWKDNGLERHSTTRAVAPFVWSRDLLPTGTYTVAFNYAGGYRYMCRFHSTMRGKVSVAPGTSAPSGLRTTTFTIRVARFTVPAGYEFTVQYRRSTSTIWLTYAAHLRTATTTFRAASRGLPAGTYQFRAQMRQISTGRVSDLSPARNITVS